MFGHWIVSQEIIPKDFEENPPLGFVYKITNLENNKFYIGQKKIQKVEKRPPLKRKGQKT